jgi:hypothetical protein
MKIEKSKILFLIGEGTLIFFSVYGAFLLEDKRTFDFERKQLVKKLDYLLDDFQDDSLAFSQFTDSTSEFFALSSSLHWDTVAIMLIANRHPNYIDSVLTICYETNVLTSYAVSTIPPWNETSTFNQVINKNDLFISDDLYPSLVTYNYRRNIILEEFEDLNTVLERFSDQVITQYDFVSEIPLSELQKSEFVNDPFLINTLHDGAFYKWNLIHRFKTLNRDGFESTIKAIKNESMLQQERINSLFQN